MTEQTEKRIPEHVSIIMDGNGRWAQQKGLPRSEGHKAGVESVKKVIEASIENGVRYLSLYAFSEENWGRPKDEVDNLMQLLAVCIAKESDMLLKNKIRLRIFGNIDRLPTVLRKSLQEVTDITKDNTALELIVFISYSGKWDIVRAFKKMALNLIENSSDTGQITQISSENIEKYLVTAGVPDPDMIIRTSGEQRLSNYMLWQAAYSELIFTDVLWPDFSKEDFKKALDEYSRRFRRYGIL